MSSKICYSGDASLDSQRVLVMMTEFDEKKERQSPLFKFVRIYMRMVLLIYMFIRATRVIVNGSCTSCLWTACESTSSLTTNRSMPDWFLSTMQRWQPFTSQIQTYIKSSWVETSQLTKIGYHSVPSACSWAHQPHHESHRRTCGDYTECQCSGSILPYRSITELGSWKKHGWWLAHQQLYGRNTMNCH